MRFPSATGGVNEKARQDIKAREREHRRESLTARTDHDRHDRRDRGSDRDRGSTEDRRREQRRDGDRGRDRADDGRSRDSRGERQRDDRERDRRSGRDDRGNRGLERPPSERRSGGGGWEDSSTPLRSAPRDEWEETPARPAGGRGGSTAPSPNPYWQRGGSTPLIRAGTSSRGVCSRHLLDPDGLLLCIKTVGVQFLLLPIAFTRAVLCHVRAGASSQPSDLLTREHALMASRTARLCLSFRVCVGRERDARADAGARRQRRRRWRGDVPRQGAGAVRGGGREPRADAHVEVQPVGEARGGAAQRWRRRRPQPGSEGGPGEAAERRGDTQQRAAAGPGLV